MLRRSLAFFIDHITISIGIGLVSSIHITLAKETSFDTLQSMVFGYSIVMWYAYMVVRDYLFGRSIGKKMMRLAIKQTTNDTQVYSKGSLIKRNVTLLVLPVEVILFLFNKQNRRLGDLWAGSIVRNEKEIRGTA